MSQAIITEMISALDLEIQAIKRKGGSSSIEVRGGEYCGRAEGNALYAFQVTEEVYLRDESPVRVVVGEEEVDGIVVSFGEGILVVALDRELGPKIPFARLISDNSFLIERLKKKLEEVREGAAQLNHEKADQVIGARPCRSIEAAVDQALILGRDLPNAEQRAAIATALGSDVTYLWGPPGTGKTTTLARIVDGYYRGGLSVLVVSNTNVAVDTALEKIGDLLSSSGDLGFQQGAVLRYGPVRKPELYEKYGDQVVLDKVLERLGRNLEEDKLALEAQRANIQADVQGLQGAVQELEELEKVKDQVSQARAGLEQALVKQAAGRSTMVTVAQKIDSLKADLERANGMRSLRRFFAGLNPDRLTKDLARAQAELSAQQDALSGLESYAKEARSWVTQAEQWIGAQSERLRHYPLYGECKRRLEAYNKQVGELGQRIQQIQNQLDALRDEVLKNCRILATTVYRTYLKAQVERSFDAVVIDEASMLVLPMVFYAAGLAGRHVVVAGDFRQLPPIVTSEEPEAIEWLKQDVFRKAGIAGAVERGEAPDSLINLREQYRMHEEICSVINDVFYNDSPLETSVSVRKRSPRPFPLGESALMYVDTGPHHPWAAMRLGTFSRYNVLHALLLRNIVCHLNEKGYLDSDEALGIVAPYTAQASLIQRLLDERLDNRGSKLAATVHQFQGNEKDTMLIDLTDSLGARPSRFMRAYDKDNDGARLLNVAISRARCHVVLLANFDYLLEKTGTKSVVGEILDRFVEAGQPLDVHDLLPLGPDDWLDGLRPLEPLQLQFDSSTAGVFTEGTFYPAFTQDLESATHSIVIFSPFVTARGAGRWVDILRGKVLKGLRVRLVTRPPGDHGGVLEAGLEELIAGIMKVGVVVDLRAGMHEKFAIIDTTVLWHGSLNIFSHRDTSESMLRIPSSAACRQMARFVTSPVRRRPGQKDEEVDLTARENPDCPVCSRLMVWKNRRYGIYFSCEAGCGGKIDPRRSAGYRPASSSRAILKEHAGQPRSSKIPRTDKVCPKCGKALTYRTGRHGPFFGCSSYPRCRHTEPLT